MNRSNRFVQLKDLVYHVEKKVNIMGVVMEFSIPRKSKGTDYVSVLKIVDESRQSPELSVNMFTGTSDELPRIKSYGDLIVLYRVTIKNHDGELYALFNKKASSFALLDGKFSVGIYPYQDSTGCSSLDFDKPLITDLRKWRLSSQFHPGTSVYLLSLKDIKEREYFDLVCKVLHICEVSNDIYMLLVWDGTDVPPLSSQMTSLQPEIESLPLPRDIMSTFPCLGTIFRVIADQAYEKLGQHFHGINKWVRFRNITCEVRSGLWYGLLTPSSKVRLLSNMDPTVSDRRRNYSDRFREQGGVPLWTSPSSSSLTEWQLLVILSETPGAISYIVLLIVLALQQILAEN
ncbi:hypothetical protein L1049_017591 [Liquidambar formosana]|uniref:Protection of telomeres protein 1 n=1 Tax=Liquidambar formosana TaxID=63359 RepID=A0AAP0X7G1_LIQFO